MTFSIEKHTNELIFIPLGGAGEIGMNFNLYQLDGKLLIVDCGAGFADDYLPGVDMLVPDIRYLAPYRDHIAGLVLTHAHEDHLGAVQYIWKDLRCPIYTTPFTSAFLQAKLVEVPFGKHVEIHEVAIGSRFNVGPFGIEMIGLTHSAPEMQALMIRTRLGNIMHTGDWKFDPSPVIGEVSDTERLRQCGDEGVLALVGDSTNVFHDGSSGSEGALAQSLTTLIADCKKLVAITTFASNVARIAAIAEAARVNGRRIMLAGRSLWRIVAAAKQAGYLENIEFLDDSAIRQHPRESLLLLCTGCQGEPLAAISKIAHGTHPTIRLTPEDTVIFSSKIIPGNEKRIYRLFNQFVRMNVEVLTERDHFVHVSGHPARDELQKMYELVRPKVAIPVHGELVHMHEHVRLAKSWGVANALQVADGDVIRLAPGVSEKIAVVHAGALAIDGYYLQDPDGGVMKMRRRMRQDGAVMVTLWLAKSGDLKTNPVILTPGLFDPIEDHDTIMDLTDEVIRAVEDYANATGGKMKMDVLERNVRSAVKRFVKKEMNKYPPILVHIQPM
jgi:ribonuclease J